MATKTTGIKFEFTGDASKAVESFKQLAQAGKGAGGDLAKAGAQIEKALAAAEGSANRPGLKTSIFSQLKKGLAGGIDAKAESVGLGGLASELGGGEAAVAGLGSTAALAAASVAALGAAGVAAGKYLMDGFIQATEAVDGIGDVLQTTADKSSQIAGMFKGVGLDASAQTPALAKFALAVTKNAAELNKYGVIIAKTADGSVDYQQTLLNVASAYQASANDEDKARVGTAAFGKGYASMIDLLETNTAKLKGFGDLFPKIRPEDEEALKRYKAQTAELGTSWEQVKVTLGRPILGEVTTQLENVNQVASATSKLFSGDFSGAWDTALHGVDKSRPILHDAANAMTELGLAGLVAAQNAGKLGQTMVLASVAASNASSGFAKILDKQTTGASAAIKFRDAIGGLAKVQTSATADAAKYATAVDDGSKAIADAEESAARRVVDAQENVAKARLSAARAAEDATMRVADAEQALVDAASSSAGDNPLDRDRKIGDARKALDRAKLEASRSQVDAAGNVKSAEDDLVQAQVDGAKAVADAQASAAERIAKAQEAATQAIDAGTVSVGSMTGKVDELVKSTMDMAFQTAQAGGSTADVKAKVDEAKAALDLYAPAMGLTADQVKYYKDQLNLIPPFVGTKVRIDFSTVTSGAQGMALAGINAVIVKALTDQLQIPQFAGGGTFRSSSGAGLAVLHDGEKVLTPDQQSGGDHYHFHGSVITERDVADFIARAKRRGVQGL